MSTTPNRRPHRRKQREPWIHRANIGGISRAARIGSAGSLGGFIVGLIVEGGAGAIIGTSVAPLLGTIAGAAVGTGIALLAGRRKAQSTIEDKGKEEANPLTNDH